MTLLSYPPATAVQTCKEWNISITCGFWQYLYFDSGLHVGDGRMRYYRICYILRVHARWYYLIQLLMFAFVPSYKVLRTHFNAWDILIGYANTMIEWAKTLDELSTFHSVIGYVKYDTNRFWILKISLVILLAISAISQYKPGRRKVLLLWCVTYNLLTCTLKLSVFDLHINIILLLM